MLYTGTCEQLQMTVPFVNLVTHSNMNVHCVLINKY